MIGSERTRKYAFDNHSRSKWDVTSTIGRKRDVKAWIRQSHTIYIGWSKYDHRKTAINAWILQLLTLYMGCDKS